MGEPPHYNCDSCDFKLWLPIATMQTSVLGLYDDRRFPGRAILVFRGHVEHLHQLSGQQGCDFFDDATRAGRALLEVTDASRVNYAVLGNTHPHLHWHLVPRAPPFEPRPTRPPWEDPRPAAPLDSDTASRLVARIADALDSLTG